MAAARAGAWAVALAVGCALPAQRAAPPAPGTDSLPEGRDRAAGTAVAAAARAVAARPPEWRTGEEVREARRSELARLLNLERAGAGLPELAWDPQAAAFAQAEAERLAGGDPFGHVAPDGSKPYQRWARAGGTAHLRENLFRLEAGAGRAHVLFDPARAHARLMASGGHRRTILDPSRTGVGVGVAYDRARNSVYVVQELVSRHLEIDGGSARWRPGESRELRGKVREASDVVPWMAVLFREPLPGGPEARREARRRAYREGGRERVLVLSARSFRFDAAAGAFTLRAELPAAARPGPHTLVLYAAQRERAARAGARRATADGFPAAVLDYDVGPP